MKRVHIARLCVVVLAFVLASCSDLMFSPNNSKTTGIALRPYFAFVGGSAVDINVIHITAKKLPNGPVFEFDIQVDPSASEWNLPIELEPNANYEVIVSLINRVAGVNNVVSSGKIELSVTTGLQQTPAPVPTFPGPPENLSVTSVVITPRDQSMLEGDQVDISAAVAGPTNPVIVWTSTNPNVAVFQNGKLVAKAPGTATIQAQVGPKTDNITVTVGAKATSVELLPATATIVSINSDATFTGRVLDTRNAVVPGLSITCNIADATIATQVSPCVFRGRKNGTTTITATTTQAGRTVSQTATLKVEQKAVTVGITPGSASFDAFGATQQLTATAKDANGNDVSGLTFTWSSDAASVATVDANGLVTSRGNGTANIKVDIAGASATAGVTVQQRAASITVTPDEKTLVSINETAQLRAEVKDARGNVMTVPVIWQTTMPTVADVNATGLVTATGDGAAVVTAIAGTQRASATINVDRVPARVRILPADPQTINAGTTKQYNGAVVDANGFVMTNRPAIVWTSSNTSVATINSSSGLASGNSAGTTQISARSGTTFGSTTLSVVGTATGTPFTTGNVLVISNRSDQNTYFINKMTPLMPGVTFTSQTSATALTPTYMAQFKVVVVWEDGIFSGAPSIGNALATYVANGGNVVLGTFFWQDKKDNAYYGSFNYGWGAFEAYDPFSQNGLNGTQQYSCCEYRSATLNTATMVAHPLTNGVTALTVNQYPNGQPANAAATVVASYLNGSPAIAFRTFAASRVVALSFVPVHDYYGATSISGDFNLIVKNAIIWAGSGGTPVVTRTTTTTTLLQSITALPQFGERPTAPSGSQVKKTKVNYE